MTPIALNQIQHYAYCPRQWWLIAREGQWSDNAFVAEGDALHRNADDPDQSETRGGVRIARSLPVGSQRLAIYGIADIVEFRTDDQGNLRADVIEYKRGKPDERGVIDEEDLLQLTGQMLCIEEMTGAVCRGYVFYDRIKRRVEAGEYSRARNRLEIVLADMRACVSPPPPVKERCGGCSLKEICLPRCKPASFAGRLQRRLEL